ncbi:MAG: hypothetical protein Q8K67_08095 [Geothrix sp.]|nr:hypothetical protein [Geothrix sp.]
MPLTHAELLAFMTSCEDEHLEFKEAKANEGGGRLILGVTDKKPRIIVGSGAFP